MTPDGAWHTLQRASAVTDQRWQEWRAILHTQGRGDALRIASKRYRAANDARSHASNEWHRIAAEWYAEPCGSAALEADRKI
jgi:hypothetical protein